jgi:hypothetical protein
VKKTAGISMAILLAAVSIGAQNGSVFLSVNPAAAVSFVPAENGSLAGFFASAILPVLANLESGVSLGGGLHLGSRFLEGRLSIGNSNDYLLVLQGQIGHYWMLGRRQKGLYAGASLRYMDIVNLYSGVHNQSLLPLASLGYWLGLGRFFIDFRVSQMFMVLSWSSMPHTTPALAAAFSPLTAISPVMPLCMISVGYRF